MLDRARARNCYDELVLAELTGYLTRHERAFDLAVCADTLIYFGDLTHVLAGFHGAMRDGAHLCFTVEKSVAHPVVAAGFELHPHGRYSHAPEYLATKAREAGLEILHWDEAPVRHEAGAAVMGLIVTAKRSGSNALPIVGGAR
jgi:predicted TPR repeat methyltransferase